LCRFLSHNDFVSKLAGRKQNFKMLVASLGYLFGVIGFGC
jgi:hypothetical protein